MKTLRARFKKTEVSLRPLRCPVSPSPGFLSPWAWAIVTCQSDTFGSCHVTRAFPVQNSSVVPLRPQVQVYPFSLLWPPLRTFLSTAPCCHDVPPPASLFKLPGHHPLAQAPPSPWSALSLCCCLSNLPHSSQFGSVTLLPEKPLLSPATVTTRFSEDSLS